jgi:NDP-sugar pyrophosphorylase family protein
MKIVIPMAGHSRRFKEAGYKIPKPFMLIDGRPMIHHLCDVFEQEDEFYFVCDKEHLVVPEYRRILNSVAHPHHLIGVEPSPEGPVGTALTIEKEIPQDEEVMISYCDFRVVWNAKQFKNQAVNYDGAIPCFRGQQPASYGTTYYAYVRTNPQKELLELREKQSFTPHRENEYASVGIYYFNAWDLFVHYAKRVLKEGKGQWPEFYVSLLYNPMVEDGKKILITEVEKFICWGTPADVEQYLFWSTYFAKYANAIMGNV